MDVDEGVFEWDWKWQTGEQTTLGGSRRDVDGRCEGTFFVWFRLPEGLTVDRLLAEHGVALAPGEGFGPRGAGWARLSLAVRDDVLDEGLVRLAAALA